MKGTNNKMNKNKRVFFGVYLQKGNFKKLWVYLVYFLGILSVYFE